MSLSTCNWTARLASESDVPAIEALIPLSVRGLQAGHYSTEQIAAALATGIFGVDRQLIRDGTYFVVEAGGVVAGCGGWSRRKSLFGGDAARTAPDPELDPMIDPARIRAFFVHPDWARRGIGRCILAACEEAISRAGFRTVEIVATLPGKALYAPFGYEVTKLDELPMHGGLKLPVVRMTKTI